MCTSDSSGSQDIFLAQRITWEILIYCWSFQLLNRSMLLIFLACRVLDLTCCDLILYGRLERTFWRFIQDSGRLHLLTIFWRNWQINVLVCLHMMMHNCSTITYGKNTYLPFFPIEITLHYNCPYWNTSHHFYSYIYYKGFFSELKLLWLFMHAKHCSKFAKMKTTDSKLLTVLVVITNNLCVSPW